MAESRARYGSVGTDPSALGEPLEFPISKRSAINRFLNGAMSEALATYDENLALRGIPGKELEQLYKTWGQGKWGQIVTGNVMIDPEHLEGPGNMIVPPDAPFEGERFEGFKAIAAAGKAHGSLIVPQVSHPGRQAPDNVQKFPISASDVQLVGPAMGKTFAKPRAATTEDIQGFIKGFTYAAVFLQKAGFDGIQLHGAHGYLLAQFLSPATNKRTDQYGGSLVATSDEVAEMSSSCLNYQLEKEIANLYHVSENRMRLILEIAASIRAQVSDRFILGIKINSVEFQDEGFTPEEAVTLCQSLEKARFDYVETSGGTYESAAFSHKKDSTRKREAYFIEFAEQIHKSVSSLKVYTTGGFKTVDGMVRALGSVDGVGIGRAAAQEPDLPQLIISGKASGVSKYAVDEDNLIVRMTAATLQIKQIASGQKPDDLADPEVVKKILALFGTS